MSWLLFGLTLLFMIVWQAPALYMVQGLASYLPLHMFTETFSIVVSMLVFGVAWNVYSTERPGNIVILACALLAVGLIDFAHTLSFKGMPDFVTPSGPEKAINLWLAARLIAALALLTVAMCSWQRSYSSQVRRGLLVVSLAVSAAVIWLGLFYPQAWPRTFIAGQGLTPFKIGAEYAIVAILLIPAVLFYRQARQPQSYDATGLFAATVITILSELSFTVYSDVADIFNMLGHLYKIVAYMFIYRAVFVSSVREPFQRLDAELGENQRISKELRTASIYTRSLIEASLDPLVTISAEGKITDANKATEAATGRSRSELIGTDFSDYFTDPDNARKGNRQVFQNGKVVDYPLALRHRDGHITYVLYNASVYRNEAGEVQGVFASARDISEQQRALLLRAQLAAIVESSSDAIIGKSLDGVITSWNKGAEKIYGYSAAEVVGKHITTLAPAALHAEIDGFLKTVRNGGTVENHETERVRKDGTTISVALTLSPIRDASGIVGGISTIARDITERKQADEALRREQALLSRIMVTSPVGIAVVSKEGQITFANPQAERILGLRKEQLTQLSYNAPEWHTTAIDGGPFSDEQQPFSRVMATRQPVFDVQHAIVWQDGHRVLLSINGAPIFDARGEIEGVVFSIEDITLRKLADEILRRSEHGLAEAQRIAHLGNWGLDLVKNTLAWSDEIYRIFEIDPDKFGASYEAFLNSIHPEDRDRVNRAYTDSVKSKVPYDIVHRLQMPDGRIKYVNEKCETYYGADGKPLNSFGTVHDITDRILDQQALLRLNRELRAISNCNQSLMRADNEQALLDEICRIVCEDAGYRMAWVGYPENDEGKTIRVVAMAGVEDGYLEQARITWADTERGHGPSGTAIRSGMSVCFGDFGTDPRAAPWREAALQRGYRSSISMPLKDEKANTFGILTIYSGEPNAFTPEEMRLLEELAGDMAFGIVVLRTRVERKHAEDEIRSLNRELEQRVAARTADLEAANKELESFSYSVSHDLRSPLRAIDGFSHILLEDYVGTLDDEGKRMLNIVRENTRRMGRLIDDILKFSRSGRNEINSAEIDMEKLAREVMDELQTGVAQVPKLQFEVGSLPPASGDHAMMRQVFVNLLSNALKFSRTRETPRIEVGASIEGTEAVYHVKDNGVGFDMQYADKLFGVFQRLHSIEEFEGTGIGLAIVKRIVTRHGGRVWVVSKVNEGATMYFTLPQARPQNE